MLVLVEPAILVPVCVYVETGDRDWRQGTCLNEPFSSEAQIAGIQQAGQVSVSDVSSGRTGHRSCGHGHGWQGQCRAPTLASSEVL